MKIYNKGSRTFHIAGGQSLFPDRTVDVKDENEAKRLLKSYPRELMSREAKAEPVVEAPVKEAPKPVAPVVPTQEEIDAKEAKEREEAEEAQRKQALLEEAKATDISKMSRKELEKFVKDFELDTIKIADIKTKDELVHVIEKALGRE